MRLPTIAIVCFFIATGLAGCFGGDAAPSTSASLLDRAEAVARSEIQEMDDGHDHSHDSTGGAVLVAVISLEVSDAARVRSATNASNWFLPLLDGEDTVIGDGLAPAWAFMYRQGDHDAMYHMIVVDTSGQTTGPTPVPDGFPIDLRGPALPDSWPVGSEQAAPIAAASNPHWAELAEGDDAYVLSYLVHHTDKRGSWGPTWIFEAGTFEGPDHRVAAVDAVNGTYRPLGVIDPFSPVATVQGTVSGSLSTSSPTAEHALAVETPGHKKMKFVIDVAGSANNFDLVATGPRGEEFVFWWDSGNRQARWQTYDVSDGDWTLSVTLTQGEEQAYTVHWCAVGATRCDGL